MYDMLADESYTRQEEDLDEGKNAVVDVSLTRINVKPLGRDEERMKLRGLAVVNPDTRLNRLF